MENHDSTTPPQPGEANPPQGQGQGAPAQGGLDPNIGALLAYLLGWIGGLIMMLTQQHPEVRFHGLQSILYNVAAGVAVSAIWILGIIAGFIFGPFAFLFFLLAIVVGIAAVVGWIVLVIKGYQLEHFKLPLIGDLSEQWTNYQAA